MRNLVFFTRSATLLAWTGLLEAYEYLKYGYTYDLPVQEVQDCLSVGAGGTAPASDCSVLAPASVPRKNK